MLLAAAVVMTTAGLVGGGLSPAGAAPKPSGTTVTETIRPGSTYSTRSNTQAQDIRITIPSGLSPTTVLGTLVFDNDATGKVEILAHDKLVATVRKKSSTRSAKLRFPVSRADLSGRALRFQLRYVTSALTDPKLYCIRTNDGNVQLTDVRVRTTGKASAPTTLADFFSSAVRSVSITVPADPDRDLQQAALTADAAITHSSSDRTKVAVTTGGDTAPTLSAATGRVVSFVPGTGEAHTTITTKDGIPTLTVTGDPSKLPAAAAALGDRLLALAQVPDVTRLEQRGTEPATPSLTLADLGQANPQLSGIGESEWSVGVRQSDFGSAVDQVKVHLVGTYTELPAQLTAVLTYYWNDQLVGSHVLDNDDTDIDTTVTIPKTQITSGNTLSVHLDAVPSGEDSGTGGNTPGEAPTFDCNGALSFLPVVASFDGKASTVTGRVGQPTGPGFERFPQTLGNTLTVAYGGSSPASGSLADTGSLVHQLQLLNADQLSVKVVSADDLIDSSAPGLLVDATADQIDDLGAPLRMAEFRSIDREDVDFGVGVRKPYAALQAFEQNGRDLLTLSSWSPDKGGVATAQQLQHTLVDDLARNRSGWYALSGDLAVQQSASRKPVVTDSNSIVPQPEKVRSISPYAWWILAFVVVLVLLLIAQRISKRRLRQRAAAIVDAQQAREETDATDEHPDDDR